VVPSWYPIFALGRLHEKLAASPRHQSFAVMQPPMLKINRGHKHSYRSAFSVRHSQQSIYSTAVPCHPSGIYQKDDQTQPENLQSH
jgi:hypothetical protein